MKTLLNTLIAVALSNLVLAQTDTENYIKTTSPQLPVQTETAVNNLNSSFKIETITYFDGLGRPKQQIGIRQSPTGKDIITHIGYDTFGRQDKSYLPYVPNAAGGEGLFRTGNQAQATTTFYNTPKYEHTQNPYSETHFEASPLNRVLEQGAPGTDWKLDKTTDTDHTIKFDYQTNDQTMYALYQVAFTENDTQTNTRLPNSFYHPTNSTKPLPKTKTGNRRSTTYENTPPKNLKTNKDKYLLKRTLQ